MFTHRICPRCGAKTLLRRRRRFLARLYKRAVYQCSTCGAQVSNYVWRHWYWLGVTAQCPRCGNTNLERFRRPDKIEGMYGALISRVQKWFGAPLLYCAPCRLQFYDFRRRVHNQEQARRSNAA